MAAPMILVTVLTLGGVVAAATPQHPGGEQVPPEHQVAAIYFHRTVRCPTCKRIGAIAEEAVTKGFSEESKERLITFQFIDFQDEKNVKLAKAFGIESPTLVLLNAYENETICWAALPQVWQLVGKPDEFRKYVHDGVTRYLEQSKEDAEKERENGKKVKK
jgi:hypothetical protein